jgi:cytochrome P450
VTAVAERPIAEPGYGQAPASPAGPADGETPTAQPPGSKLSPLLQGLRFSARPMSFNIGNHQRYGDVWTLRIPTRREGFVITCHPDHLQSLMKAKPEDAPSLTGESPLRPILGPNSILTSVGERHMRQRKLLLPPFHGEAVQRYVAMIREVAEREIDRWPVRGTFALAPRMQAVTLEVIMRGVFGIEGDGGRGSSSSAEHRMRSTIRRLLAASTTPLYQLVELRNAGSKEPRDLLAALLRIVDRQMYAVIRARRADLGSDARDDVLSVLLQARDEDGEPLTDPELRDELMSLVLAGHETTANSLAWAFERLLRNPGPYRELRERVRGGDGAEYVEATIHESMRVRPVIPMIVRMVMRPWRLGEHVVPARTPVAVSILGLHHRDDVYPQPQDFRPERFLGRTQPDDPGDRRSGETGRRAFIKPGTYTWIPFGGGVRRCLGATLAMAEQRVVLEAIARRADLEAVEPAAEAPRMRNVTMIPRHGCRMRVLALS